MWIMPQIKRDISLFTGYQNNLLSNTVCVPNLVKHIRISSTHFPDDHIGIFDLTINTIEYILQKKLLINSLAGSTCLNTGSFDAKFINIPKFIAKRHHNEDRQGFHIGI